MRCILVDTLLEPGRISGGDPRQYQILISQARSTGLLGSLTAVLANSNLLDQVPSPIRRHLDSAWVVYTKTKQDIAYESACLSEALEAAGERLVLLKGAAYMEAGLPSSIGRTLSDIDILAPEGSIRRVEISLKKFGWQDSKQDAYNERYYRKWMHEIPPKVHRRGAVLDLHHTILPPTAASKVNASLLFEEVVEVKPGIFTLSSRDRILHSAAHLFHEGEFHHGLRDLWDLDRMLRDFSTTDPQLWDELLSRAIELDLMDSLYHSLVYSQLTFGTPVPSIVTRQASSWRRRMRKPFMDFLFRRAFSPNHPDCRLPLSEFALYLLYLRSHYLRMPLYLLIPHLTRKAWMSHFGETSETEEELKTAGKN